MPRFDPRVEYKIIADQILIEDFHRYAEEFVIRPPYQRKAVWSTRKQQDLLDSLFRRYYIPRIVLRNIRLSDDRTVKEVIDGQQRITTVQAFFRDEIALPKTLADLNPELPGKRYSDLPSDIRRFVDRLSYQADIVTDIGDPKNPDQQTIATEIFWRLQQGESLNYMEEAHSKLSSLVRNFVVKYADDQRFDFDAYEPIDGNPDKHPFFRLLSRKNNRMQHLALLVRLLLIEESDQIVEVKNSNVVEFIEETKQNDGIDNLSLEDESYARRVIKHLNTFYSVFKNDPMIQDGDSLRELSTEYFIISMYLLVRHLSVHYVFDEKEKSLFREFMIEFHNRWKRKKQSDTDILLFANNRQQSSGEIEIRDRVLRQLFFEFVSDRGHEMLTKDQRRAFSEAERIAIYRRDEGLCQMCLAEGKPEREAQVSWDSYQADHVIPHSKGGSTVIKNGQVLCEYHNKSKGAAYTSP